MGNHPHAHYYRELLDKYIPYSYSLLNYMIYILDKQLKPVSTRILSKIIIDSTSVLLGYLNNRELID
jgi:non-ribosomal peptide synthetase component F